MIITHKKELTIVLNEDEAVKVYQQLNRSEVPHNDKDVIEQIMRAIEDFD